MIVGHSERRQYFGETDGSVADKVQAAAGSGLRPIVCVGETLSEREAGRTLDVVHRQVDAVCRGTRQEAWLCRGRLRAGMGDRHRQGRRTRTGPGGPCRDPRPVVKAFSAELADVTPVLYGGSVKPDNAHGLLGCPDVDGALVGGASLEAESFAKIVQAGVSRT